MLVLHGGPGLGILPSMRQHFDPDFYRIILFDQRGAGKSTPHAELRENTTWDLVADIETIRKHLGIDKWLITGGSWGSTLSLAYAQRHPEAVLGLIMRGIFLLRRKNFSGFINLAHIIFSPDYWDEFVSVVSPAERGDMINAYYKLLTSDNEAVRLRAAIAWSQWEGRTLTLLPDAALVRTFSEPHIALSLARIECHYFVNGSFFECDDFLLKNAQR